MPPHRQYRRFPLTDEDFPGSPVSWPPGRTAHHIGHGAVLRCHRFDSRNCELEAPHPTLFEGRGCPAVLHDVAREKLHRVPVTWSTRELPDQLRAAIPRRGDVCAARAPMIVRGYGHARNGRCVDAVSAARPRGIPSEPGSRLGQPHGTDSTKARLP